MGILSKIKGWLFKTPSLPITPSVSETDPAPSLNAEIEHSLSQPMVSEVNPKKVIEEDKDQPLKIDEPIQTLEAIHEEQPIIIQNDNMPSQAIPVMPELTQSDHVQPLVIQPENMPSQIIPTNKNNFIQPLTIQPKNIQPVQQEDLLSQNIQPVHSGTKVKRSRRTKTKNSTRSKKKLKESANSGN